MAQRIIYFLPLLLTIVLVPSVHCLTLKLSKAGAFCASKTVGSGERFTGSYVVSGYDEASVVFKIYPPNSNQTILVKDKMKEGTWDFVAQKPGDYKVCFKSLSQKDNYVSLELQTVTAQEEDGKQAITSDNVNEVNKALSLALAKLKKVRTNLNFQKTRETIHTKNLESLESQIHWCTVFKAIVVIGIAVFQVYTLTGYFRKQRKVFV